MLRKNKPSRLKESQRQKQKLKMTLIIVSAVSLMGMIAGIFIYLNFSQSQKSKAESIFQGYRGQLPTEFYQPKMIIKIPDPKLNGVSYKVPQQIPSGQKTVIESAYGQITTR